MSLLRALIDQQSVPAPMQGFALRDALDFGFYLVRTQKVSTFHGVGYAVQDEQRFRQGLSLPAVFSMVHFMKNDIVS